MFFFSNAWHIDMAYLDSFVSPLSFLVGLGIEALDRWRHIYAYYYYCYYYAVINVFLQDALNTGEIVVTAFNEASITVIFGKSDAATGYTVTIRDLDSNSAVLQVVTLTPSASSRVTFSQLASGVNYEITLATGGASGSMSIEQRTSESLFQSWLSKL